MLDRHEHPSFLLTFCICCKRNFKVTEIVEMEGNKKRSKFTSIMSSYKKKNKKKFIDH